MYFFQGTPDGANPASSLLDVDASFYGTTQKGGEYGNGTVFKITQSGAESVLYSFKGPPDARGPLAGLIEVDGLLYGTTQGGGDADAGTVFTITPSGKESVLHSFGIGLDGAYPAAALIDVGGTLYGTTVAGGSTRGDGTVFKITPRIGAEAVIHTFYVNSPDGVEPEAPLLDLNGTLYGTTKFGGDNGGGTLFEIKPSGYERVLHSFLGSYYSDGAYPTGGLIAVNGSLYGTTIEGGAYCTQNSAGCGTVFKVTTAGVESVLYSFTSLPNGVYPLAGLVDVNGALYGTTEHTIFKVTTSGKHTVLHHFTGTNGAYPEASLIDVGGVFYGTAANNGPGSTGNGTVFSLAL